MVGAPKLTDDSKIVAIASRLEATPAQVLVAWGAHRGYSVIPKSVQEERILSNFQQVVLSDADYEEVSQVPGGKRTRFVLTSVPTPRFYPKIVKSRFNIPFTYQPKWDINIFDEPEEKEANYKVKIE